MGKKKNESGKTIELEEMNIFLRIPKEAVALEVTASLLDANGKVMRVKTSLSVSDIRDRRQDFLDNVDLGDDYDAHFVLTDEGRAYMESIEKDRQSGGESG